MVGEIVQLEIEMEEVGQATLCHHLSSFHENDEIVIRNACNIQTRMSGGTGVPFCMFSVIVHWFHQFCRGSQTNSKALCQPHHVNRRPGSKSNNHKKVLFEIRQTLAFKQTDDYKVETLKIRVVNERIQDWA